MKSPFSNPISDFHRNFIKPITPKNYDPYNLNNQIIHSKTSKFTSDEYRTKQGNNNYSTEPLLFGDKKLYNTISTTRQTMSKSNNIMRLKKSESIQRPITETNSLKMGQTFNLRNTLTLYPKQKRQKNLLQKGDLKKEQVKNEKRISVMNLQLNSDEDEINKRNQQIQELEMIKYLIARRRHERLLEKQRERQKSKQKCFELIHKNQKISNDEEMQYKIIQEILIELKKSKNFTVNQEQNLKILALQTTKVSKKKQRIKINKVVQQNQKSPQPTQNSKKKIQKMTFGLNDLNSDKTYKKKIMAYIEFLYKINFSNCIYVDLKIKDYEGENHLRKYKVFIGKGNNSLLVKSLIERRFWMQVVDRKQQNINFYWTQLNAKQIHCIQQNSKKEILSESIRKKMESLTSKKNPLKDQNYKIMNRVDGLMVQNYLSGYGLLGSIYPKTDLHIVTNHIPENSAIGSKKALFLSMYYYYKQILKKNPFQYIPETFHIKNMEDEKLKQLLLITTQEKPDKIWIIKPGQNSNRGNGISLIYSKDLYSELCKKFANNLQKNTYIVQSYINKPFLYYNRKFDIRHYMMITSINGFIKAYWYHEGYIRTSSILYTTDDIRDIMIHLTNDAIQKLGESYGKFELGNKISYADFQRYLDLKFAGKKYNFQSQILEKMKQMALEVVSANFLKLDSKRKLNNFEIFGLDFMIDQHFKPWLIEINSNPCLEISCPLLARIIPAVVQNALRIGLDPLFPPPTHYPVMKRYQLSDNILQNLKFELIFDEKSQGDKIRNELKNLKESEEKIVITSQNEQQYEDEGQEIKNFE